MGLFRKLQNILPKSLLIMIYKRSIRPHIHDSVIYYDLPLNKKLESIQYIAVLTLIRAIIGSSRKKLYQDLGVESLQLWQWYSTLWCFNKIYNQDAPRYSTKLTPTRSGAYQTRQCILLMYLPEVLNLPKVFLEMQFSHNRLKQTRSIPTNCAIAFLKTASY